MCHAFERLRVIREYRSPRTIRSFTKVFIFLMPIVLSPYYVHMGIKSGNTWSPYYIAVLTSFIFGTLQGVQDVLDDPFDGISEDDINLGPVRKSVQVFLGGRSPLFEVFIEQFLCYCRNKVVRCFAFTLLHDWFKKLPPPSQPIRRKTNYVT